MAEQTKINYAEELQKLTEGASYWKPKQGKYFVIPLEEPEDCEWQKEGGEVIKQWKLIVSVDGSTPQTWTIPRSNSPFSIRGQLLKLGSKQNKLKNIGFNLLVQGEGKQRKYTIPEAI